MARLLPCPALIQVPMVLKRTTLREEAMQCPCGRCSNALQACVHQARLARIPRVSHGLIARQFTTYKTDRSSRACTRRPLHRFGRVELFVGVCCILHNLRASSRVESDACSCLQDNRPRHGSRDCYPHVLPPADRVDSGIENISNSAARADISFNVLRWTRTACLSSAQYRRALAPPFLVPTGSKADHIPGQSRLASSGMLCVRFRNVVVAEAQTQMSILHSSFSSLTAGTCRLRVLFRHVRTLKNGPCRQLLRRSQAGGKRPLGFSLMCGSVTPRIIPPPPPPLRPSLQRCYASGPAVLRYLLPGNVVASKVPLQTDEARPPMRTGSQLRVFPQCRHDHVSVSQQPEATWTGSSILTRRLVFHVT